MTRAHYAAPLVLDGQSLGVGDLARAARDPRVPVRCSPQARRRVEHGWRQIQRLVDRHLADRGDHYREYGVTTGFGAFKDLDIAGRDLLRLQTNILLSHSTGTGFSHRPDDPEGHFQGDVVRAALIARLNTFLLGHSGVRPVLLDVLLAMINAGVVPLVPVHGSVGSSGDLCPLAHLFAVLVEKGRFWVARTPEELERGLAAAELRPASELPGEVEILQGMSLEGDDGEPRLSYKEGLALTNGATLSTAVLALAVHDAGLTAAAADVALGLTLEALCGCARALDPKIHRARRQEGQMASAANLRRLLAGSRLLDSYDEVQDPYSVRCGPAVHGASRDAILFAARIVERELNAATDNPLFFPGGDEQEHASVPWDQEEFSLNWERRGRDYDARRRPSGYRPPGYDGGRRVSYSGGNFHGQPVAMAADFLAIALAELADISERRIQCLLDGKNNRDLPANLVASRGLNSGYMIAQYCAADLVSENKVLSHPATVDSIPTSANAEDHVAMASSAVRKLRLVAANAQGVLAIELMVAAQAVEWRVATPELSRTPREVASVEEALEEKAVFQRRASGGERAWASGELGGGTGAAYRAVREDYRVPTLLEDEMLRRDGLDDAIRRLRRGIRDGSLVAAVEARVETSLGLPPSEVLPFEPPEATR